jgi:phage gp36-like protein
MPTPYIIRNHVVAEIPPQYLLQALDDDGDGIEDAGLFDQLLLNVQNEIDGALGKRYDTPFQNPIPAFVADAATKLFCEKIYGRRATPDGKNPFTVKAKEVRDAMAAIASGSVPFTPGLDRKKPSASAITEKAKTSSATGKLTT